MLRQKFSGKPEHVVNYFFVAEEARQIMAQLGIRKFDDLIGRADLLDTRKGIEHWKAKGLDFARVFALPPVPADDSASACQHPGSRSGKGAGCASDRKKPARRSSVAKKVRSWNMPATLTAPSAPCCRAS